MQFFRRPPANYQEIDASTYNQSYHSVDMQHMLIDVRTPSEFKQGHLPGAVNIPLNDLQRRVDEVKTEMPVIVVCASGNRSKTGARIIAAAGHKAVYNLKGGTFTWMREGLPIEK